MHSGKCKWLARALPRERWAASRRVVSALLVAAAATGCGPQNGPSGNAADSAASVAHAQAARGPQLPSWNEGPERQAIVEFVERVTKQGSPDFTPPSERIAVFDNDGTLWAEQPIYVQLAFAIDRVKELAPEHPDWRSKQPFQAVLEGNLKAAAAGGEDAIAELIAETHLGTTTEEFSDIVSRWIDSARHPTLKRRYTELVYQPMLELLGLLQGNDFKVFIVSGGGVEFMRAWAERVYGVPKERVIGSRAKMKYRMRDGTPALERLREVDLVNDGAGKPVGIQQLIGARPIVAFGNSDGDFEMLEWTTSGQGARLGVLIHHTDDEREWAYDRSSHVGRLARALDEAPRRGWAVVDMKEDWSVVFPPREIESR